MEFDGYVSHSGCLLSDIDSEGDGCFVGNVKGNIIDADVAFLDFVCLIRYWYTRSKNTLGSNANALISSSLIDD